MVGLDARRRVHRRDRAPARAPRGAARRPTCRPSCDVVDHACSRLRVFLDEIANGAPPVPLTLFARIRGDAAGARRSKRRAPTDLFYPDLNVRAAARVAERDHAGGPACVAPAEGAPPVSARPARVAARRRGGATTMREAVAAHRGRHGAAEPARVLVDGRRAARGAREEGARAALRREAARRADRHADSPRDRRQRQGRRPAAPRSALLHRDRPRRSAPQIEAVQRAYQLGGADSVRRGARRRRRAHAAAAARGARAARGREGSRG